MDGKQIEGQLPRASGAADDDSRSTCPCSRQWLRSYHPEELFDENGKLIPELKALAPTGEHRIGANPHANGGLLMHQLRLPDFRDYGLNVPAPGSVEGQDMIGALCLCPRCHQAEHGQPQLPRIRPGRDHVQPPGATFSEVTDREWNAERLDTDEFLSASGRVMDGMLSEHMCEGWFEGYLLTGRHGFSQAMRRSSALSTRWRHSTPSGSKVCNGLPWRQPIASLNLILASNVWQQDHNGFTHQDPGFP